MQLQSRTARLGHMELLDHGRRLRIDNVVGKLGSRVPFKASAKASNTSAVLRRENEDCLCMENF